MTEKKYPLQTPESSQVEEAPTHYHLTTRNHVYPKNMILYGPPGTGKTYQTVNYALAMIENKSLEELADEPRADLLKRFNAYKEKLQIAFITFHQSYSYEDFIQGLRPNTNMGTLHFERRDGIFKRMADRARKNFDTFSQQQVFKKKFEDLLNELLIKNIDPETEEIEVYLDSSHRIYQSIIIFEMTDTTLFYKRRTKRDIIKNESKEMNIDILKNIYEDATFVKDAINQKYYEAVVQAVRQYEENHKPEKSLQQLQNYVVIIDEINRANISRVFGELITLIEPDKRYGSDNGLSVTLPSGENFTVPANLYILGTMNTADRSIALIDTALRRRFVFEAIYPDASLIADEEVQKVFKDLNEKILQEKNSPDYLIGQAFFIGKTMEDLPQVFNYQLIPLLLEYFPNRRDTILSILQGIALPVEEVNYQIKYKEATN
ncbi:AAA family ATPase [uncultured Microscilla sp.]|uniref:McrB family protein n=1 Tax=uncultured Microscilla sp. TaxID=432653 RepID=UPI002627615A|nr:AAA family ATPase [uncultured Microscilla sp.]